MGREWPARLWVVRHGESVGNVARDRAYAEGLDSFQVAERDVDVPLSPLGEKQARALGRSIGRLPDDLRPQHLYASPYVRARQTAEIALRTAGHEEIPTTVDERLREREFGVLDGLTGPGIRALYPAEADRRRRLGKFYHRPAGGESWADVIFRVRGVVGDLRADHAGERVLVVAHQVVVLGFRYVLENLTEAEILAVDRQGELVNCGMTEYTFAPSADGSRRMDLLRFNEAEPVDGVPVTAEPPAQ